MHKSKWADPDYVPNKRFQPTPYVSAADVAAGGVNQNKNNTPHQAQSRQGADPEDGNFKFKGANDKKKNIDTDDNSKGHANEHANIRGNNSQYGWKYHYNDNMDTGDASNQQKSTSTNAAPESTKSINEQAPDSEPRFAIPSMGDLSEALFFELILEFQGRELTRSEWQHAVAGARIGKGFGRGKSCEP
jgi:hypothetical protein